MDRNATIGTAPKRGTRSGHQREHAVRDLLLDQDWIALRDGNRPRLIEVKSTAAGPVLAFRTGGPTTARVLRAPRSRGRAVGLVAAARPAALDPRKRAAAMSLRDQQREQRFLSDAARGHEPFVQHATARLDAGEEPFGDSWAWIGIRRHVDELLEEAADLGSWAALADQALDREQEPADVDRARIRAVLELVARRGAQAHQALKGLAKVVSP